MKRSVKSKIDTDWTMKEIFRCLHSDSKAAIGYEIVPRLHEMSLHEAREYVPHSPFCWEDAYKYKWQTQLTSLWQRYRFRAEPITHSDLVERTMKKFTDNLDRVSNVSLAGPLVQRVLHKARSYVSNILGSYDEDEVLLNCKFGSRSTVGNPLRKSYLDLKLAGPVTGSEKQHLWFRNIYLKQDPLLGEIVRKCVIQDVCCLKVALAPKSYKIMRPILPNTLIGNFHSAGLGKVLEDRLRIAGLDIRKLQEKHKEYAKTFSSTRSHVTADLSSASDSITRALVEELLPKEWFDALDIDTFSSIDVGGTVRPNPCFCTMGIGYTFPLQTLIFYSLLKAIQELARCTTGFCSVYGDDLVYPRKIHNFVSVIFPMLGFLLNMDKTYAKEYFRESCGADFYRGVDVRPFKPMATCERLNIYDYSRFIYKLINGLLLRWEPCEIGRTLHFLYVELANSLGEINVVPPSFPDTSGIKCSLSHVGSLPLICIPPKWKYIVKAKTCAWEFTRLKDLDKLRTIRRVLPFYWQSLRQLEQGCTRENEYGDPQENPMYESKSDSIRWIRVRGYEEKVPYVTRKDRKQVVRATTHIQSWL